MLHKSETDAVTTSGKQRRQVGTPEKNLPPKSKAKLSSLGKEKKNFLIKEPLSSEEKQPQMPFSLQQRVKLSVLIIIL